MSYTQADLDAVEKALASGATTVTMGNRQITFRSVQDMRLIISTIRNALAGSSGASPNKRIQWVSGKGL